MRIRTILLAFAVLAGLSSPGELLAQYQFQSKFGSFGAAAGQFDDPRGVAVSPSGKIVVTESGNNRFQVCTDLGVCSAYGGFGTLSGEFDRPRGLGVNAAGRIFIADRGNDRIQNCSDHGVCTAFGSRGSAPGQFQSPRGVAIDHSGKIVISDTDNNRIQICTDTGTCSAFGSQGGGLGQFNSPSGVAVDSTGHIIVADRGNDRVQVCTSTGSCTAFGSFGSSLGHFDDPSGVAVDSQDRIVVVDRYNDRIQICSNLGSCTAFGTTGSGNGQFNLPWGVAVDANDRIIVADLGNNRIQIFALPADPVSIDSFTAAPDAIVAGETTTLSWTVSNASSCAALGGTAAWTAISPNSSSGSTVITIDAAGDYTFTLRCTDGSNTVSLNVVVTVAPAFLINAGLNDAWYDPATAGQGFLITVFPFTNLVFVAWFTFDVERPGPAVTANFGEPGHRWVTAYGPFSGNLASLTIEVTQGGILDMSEPVPEQSHEGTMEIEFSDCNTAVVRFDFTGLGISGEIPIQRVATDNVALCESLAAP